MRRRRAAALVARAASAWRVAILTMLALLAAPIAAGAQERKSMPRLCFLTLDPGAASSPSRRFEPFFHALRDLGYVHGRTMTIDYFAAAAGEDFRAHAEKCVGLNADIIAVTTTPAARAAKQATRATPIVMVALGDPVRTGLVDSLARPGGNVTGMSNMTTELAAKRLSLLKEAAPWVSSILVLTYLVDPIAALQVEALKEAAHELGVRLIFRDIRTAADLPTAFEAVGEGRADGLLVTSGSLFAIERTAIVELAARHRLPAIYTFSLQVRDAGGLMAYHVDEPDVFGRAAGYVDKILRGARPSELPVQQPTKFKLIINLKTATALGLPIAPSILARADEVIE
jgi:putative ABC transport system substrate-binding protein